MTDKWAGEDEISDSEIKDNWDDESEEEAPVQIVVPKKLTMKEKIAQREAKEKAEKERKQKERELMNKKLTPEEQLALKLEQQKLQQQADLNLAMEAFGVSKSKSTSINLDEHRLASKEDFAKFRSNLVSKLSEVASEPYYAMFLEDLFRDLCVPIETDDLKKISSSLTALYNEKLKAQRGTNAKKKKGKGQSIKMEKNVVSQNYDNDDMYDDDLDDFM